MYHNIKNPKTLTVALILLVLITGFTVVKTRQRQVKDTKDYQNQVNYVENTKKLLDEKSFIESLPYKTDKYDIFYSTVKDEIQIVMKNNGGSYEETKKSLETEVLAYLESIGTPQSQKVVWLLTQ